MNKIYIDEKLILDKLEKLELISFDPYLEVYQHLLTYTKRQEKKDMTTMVGLAHMVYGWMPTIISFNTEIEVNENVFELIEMGSLEGDFLSRLKGMVNNSIVGVSKLLHFMNNEDYAIWDSRVYSSITGKKGYNYHVNKVEAYISYMEQMRALSKSMDMDEIRDRLVKKGYCSGEESKLRLLELILFYTS